uniref:Uncharacterized protein n=1 Tax=Salix viminalis TaxID=40686 RepID=A0A6N2KNX6_SALVM
MVNWETWEKSLMNELLVLMNLCQGLKGRMRRKKRKANLVVVVLHAVLSGTIKSFDCPKQCLRVFRAMPIVGKIDNAYLFSCKFVKKNQQPCASQGFILARYETWTNDCPRHAWDLTTFTIKAGSWDFHVDTQKWASDNYRHPRSWDHGSLATSKCSRGTLHQPPLSFGRDGFGGQWSVAVTMRDGCPGLHH